MRKVCRHTALMMLVLWSGAVGATDKVLAIANPVQGGRWGNQSPATHPTYFSAGYGTQYAVDIYGNSGTAVSFRTGPEWPWYWDNWYGKVVEVTDWTCSDGVYVGKYVVVGVYKDANTNDSANLVGYVVYQHLNNVPSNILWKTYKWNQAPVLGYLYKWNWSQCYQVPDNASVHVHMEWGGRNGFNASWNQSWSPLKDIASTSNNRVGWIAN